MKPSEKITSQDYTHRTFAWSAGATVTIALAMVLQVTHVAHAATYTWINASSGSYTNPANWDLGAVPGSADTALMASGGTALIDSSMNNLLNSILLCGLDGSGGNVTMSGGTLSITNTGVTGFQAG
jgi:hypothetical protein